MAHSNSSEQDISEPTGLEKALNTTDLQVRPDKARGKEIDFQLDEEFIFKLDGASLTITSK